MYTKPLHDRVVIKRHKEKETSASGIIISSGSKKNPPSRGIVVAIGDGKILASGKVIPLTVNEGDNVLFDQGAGTDITLDSEELVIMHEESIIAVID